MLETHVCISFCGSNCGFAITALSPGVRNWHGAIAFTRMPRSAHSRANCLVRVLMPPLLAQYAFAPRPTPTEPAMEEKLMITPLPLGNITRAAAWQQRKV